MTTTATGLRAASLISAGLLATALLSACGGSDEPTAAENWAGSVCTGVADTRQSVSDLINSTKTIDTTSSVSAVDQLKSQINAGVDTIKSNAQNVADTVANPPQEIADEVQSARTQLESDVTSLNGALESVTTTVQKVGEAKDGSQLASAATELVIPLTAAGMVVQQTAGTVSDLLNSANGGIKEAFSSAQSCQDLTGDS